MGIDTFAALVAANPDYLEMTMEVPRSLIDEWLARAAPLLTRCSHANRLWAWTWRQGRMRRQRPFTNVYLLTKCVLTSSCAGSQGGLMAEQS